MAASDTKRHDGDSWDLASSVGATATAVAARRAMASKGPNPLIDDPFAEPLVNAVGVDAFIRMMNGEIELADDDPAFTPQRLAEGMAVRTRFFDSFFADAAAAGVRQSVILAAGLDTRAYRLAWPADTVVYEIDQPRVIEFKTRTLADLGAAPSADRRAVAVDLRDDWPQALQDNGFDLQRPTAWIAEGLLGYLPPEAQDRLFDNITALSFCGSRLGTGYVPDIPGRIAKRGREISERWRRLGLDLNWADLVYDGKRNTPSCTLPTAAGRRRCIRHQSCTPTTVLTSPMPRRWSRSATSDTCRRRCRRTTRGPRTQLQKSAVPVFHRARPGGIGLDDALDSGPPRGVGDRRFPTDCHPAQECRAQRRALGHSPTPQPAGRSRRRWPAATARRGYRRRRPRSAARSPR